MSAWADEEKAAPGARAVLVTWEGGGLDPYAAVFSDMEKARRFARTVDGKIIDTFVDAHEVKESGNG